MFRWKALLYKMLCIMLSSLLFSSGARLYECNLLCKYLMAANLCCGGWHESYGMIESVKVGFRYIWKVHIWSVLLMVTSMNKVC